jgi:U3 small nucleolar RNA-associated protein 14
MTVTETVDSTSDDRTVNNVMRHQYRVLTQAEKDFMQAVKDKGLEFYAMLEGQQSRELSLAKTKVEEAVMWAVKHITK